MIQCDLFQLEMPLEAPLVAPPRRRGPSAAEQERRRALKREKRALDRAAEATARAAKSWAKVHTPSTRQHQAKWHYEMRDQQIRAIGAHEDLVERIHEIERELARRS